MSWIVYLFIPLIGMIVASGLTFRFPLPWKNTLLHFVSGIVLAVATVDFLPTALQTSNIWLSALLFLLGAIVMITMSLLEKVTSKKKAYSSIIAGGVDLFIDGSLIGLGFAHSFSSGLLILGSLSFCSFFLTLSITALQKNLKNKLITVCSFMFLLSIGAILANFLISKWFVFWEKEIFAFAIAALLYLSIEELMTQAHKDKDYFFSRFAFFLGFLFIFLYRMI